MESDDLWGDSREAERWRIEAFAGRQRDKWSDDNSAPRPGFDRRRARAWYGIFDRIAEIQKLYENSGDYTSDRATFQVMLLVWPKMLSRRELSLPRGARKRVTADRRVFLFHAFQMGLSQFPTRPPFFDLPKIEVRKRIARDRTECSLRQETKDRRALRIEAVGRAVVMEYRRHQIGRTTLDAACTHVAEAGVEGFSRIGFDAVKAEYHKFRRESDKRGYADMRAFEAELDGKPWPNDQVWLADFPQK